MKRLAVILIAVIVSGPAYAASFEQRPAEPRQSPTYPTPAPQISKTPAEQLAKDYEIAFNSGDVKALAALYSADAVRMGPDGRVLRGRAAIQQFYVQRVGGGKAPKLTIRPGRSQMLREDVALLDGSYELADGTGGVYVITAVQESGQWRLAAVVPVPDR